MSSREWTFRLQDILKAINKQLEGIALYTHSNSRIGFGLKRKLSRLNDRKWFNIKNMDPLTIVQSRGV